MNSINLIGKHLINKYIDNLPLKIHENIDSICTFTGEKIDRGVLKKDLIKSVFTDHEYLKYKSDYCSLEAAMCMQRVIKNEKGSLTSLRNYHFFCNQNELFTIKRDGLENILFNLKNETFVFVVTFAFKKHTTFKAIVNTNNEEFIVTTDKGHIIINMSETKKIYPILQNWYTIIPEKEHTSAQPTYFSKSDILSGSNNYKKIEEYGAEKYFQENQIISKYRNSLYLELLAYILNKKGHIDA